MIPCVQLRTGLSFLHAALYIALQEPVIQNQRSQATLIPLYMITVFIEEKEEGFMRYFPELEHFKMNTLKINTESIVLNMHDCIMSFFRTYFIFNKLEGTIMILFWHLF